jgi:hypothetical protein
MSYVLSLAFRTTFVGLFKLMHLLFPSLVQASDKQTTPNKRYVTPSEMIRLIGAEEYARLVYEAAKNAPAMPVRVERNGDSVSFSGPITEEAADTLEAALAAAPTSALRVRSGGGSTTAGRRMGRLVAKHRLTVVVDEYCVSSCANYLFTAGARRVIAEGGVVVWHGNDSQKDGREFAQCGRTVSSLDGSSWLPAEISEMASDADAIAQRVADDLAFFKEIGVNDYIARAGQEPVFYGNFTMTVSDMAKFGLVNVKAPPGYGTRQYCRAANRRNPSMTVHCIAVTDKMLAYERARRTLGEVCQPDGTLRNRTTRD